MGQVRDNKPFLLPEVPNTGYPVSPFYIVQWQQSSYIYPRSFKEDDAATFDPALGTAKFSFEADDGHAHVRIYPYKGSWAYELYESGGLLRPGGGSNLFISTDRFISASLSTPISFDFDAKLLRANIFAPDDAKASGSVLAHVFSGFELLFTDPLSGSRQPLFLQIAIADSNAISKEANVCCDPKRVTLFSPAMNNNEKTLEFRDDLGPMKHFHYDLNQYVQEFAKIAPRETWPIGSLDLRNWKITGFYVGLETNSIDQRASVSQDTIRGFVETGLLIANITLVSDNVKN